MEETGQALNIQQIRYIGARIRSASRYKNPEHTIHEVYSLFKNVFVSPENLSNISIAPSHNPNEITGQATMMNKSGTYSGSVTVSLIVDEKLNIHKLIVKIRGSSNPISYPSTISPDKMEAFVKRVVNSLNEGYFFRK